MSKKQSNSRFDELISAIKPSEATTQTSESLDVQTSEENSGLSSVAKGKNPDYQRSTVYLPKTLHRQLKARAAAEGREISDIVQELVERWLTEAD